MRSSLSGGLNITMIFNELIHYHIARYQALLDYAKSYGHSARLISMRTVSPELPPVRYDQVLGDLVCTVLEDPNINLNSNPAIKKLWQLLDNQRPDVILIPGYSDRYTRMILRWCKTNRAGAVLMSASRFDDFTRNYWLEWVKSSLVSLFDAALVGGKPQARYAKQLGIIEDAIFQGYDVVDNQYWNQGVAQIRNNVDDWRDRLNLPSQYFLSVNRFVEKKNLLRLIEAFSVYFQQTVSSPWHLVLAGAGPLEAQIRNHIQNFGLEGFVHLPGYLTTDELIPYYALASGFVHASAASEQWGLVINEAMASRLPIIVSRTVGCVEDLIIPGHTGWVMNPLDVTDMANALNKLAALTVVERQKLGENAWNHIQHFSLYNFAVNAVKAAELAKLQVNKRYTRIAWHPLLWV